MLKYFNRMLARAKAFAEIETSIGRFDFYRQIDQNRETLEIIRAKAPKLLTAFPQIEGFLAINDRLLCALAENPTLNSFSPRVNEPRPWPEASAAKKDGMSLEEIKSQWNQHAYPLQQIVLLQGTRHSDRKAMIDQLETVLQRLRQGEMSGSDSDDDFGYSFTVIESSQNPTFFDQKMSAEAN